MKSIEIKGSLRTETGKKATRELRKDNGVPCVLYGTQKDENGNQVATHFTVPTEGLRNLVYTPHIYVVDLNIDGNAAKGIIDLVQKAGAELVGMGFLIEKSFQHGGDYLRAQGIHVESLAIIESLENCQIKIKD